MPRLRRGPALEQHGGDDQSGTGLPVRWAVIGLLTAGAAGVGYYTEGPVAAVVTAATVAAALHKVLA